MATARTRARSLAALSERDVFAVLRYLSHDPALVNLSLIHI